MDKYFVIGHPVKHSLSPEIHKMFAAQFDIEMSYETRDFEPGGFIEGMAVLRREDSPKGANVTHPFKMDAYQYCDEVTPRARKCEAVNTLIFDGNRVLGDTTDGKGFVNDVTQRCGASLTGARVLILGAGGAGRGLVAALQEEGCARIYIANRTPESALRWCGARLCVGQFRGFDQREIRHHRQCDECRILRGGPGCSKLRLLRMLACGGSDVCGFADALHAIGERIRGCSR